MKNLHLVLGASANPDRYSFLAVQLLQQYQYPIVALGNKQGQIGNQPIITTFPAPQTVDTVTLYINPQLQTQYIDQLLALAPRRVIFNPGTENPALAKVLAENNIEIVEACTLVLLRTGQY